MCATGLRTVVSSPFKRTERVIFGSEPGKASVGLVGTALRTTGPATAWEVLSSTRSPRIGKGGSGLLPMAEAFHAYWMVRLNLLHARTNQARRDRSSRAFLLRIRRNRTVLTRWFLIPRITAGAPRTTDSIAPRTKRAAS